MSIDSLAGPIIRVATITLERPAPVEVTYGAPGRPVLQFTVNDLTATPSNTILFIANDTAQVDGVLVTGEALWEWSPEAGRAATW